MKRKASVAPRPARRSSSPSTWLLLGAGAGAIAVVLILAAKKPALLLPLALPLIPP